jgi:ABC-type branched-subunit amino acid transport system substrate-binding protein
MQVRRAFGLLAVAGLLVGCSAGRMPFGNRPAAEVAPPVKVALLVPLTSGSSASLGQAMVNAARIALDAPGAPSLDPIDTGSTPAAAAEAARTAIQHGDRLIIGPLTAPDTAAVAPIAKAANVPVLAFTSDPARAEPGVWVLGLTPAQQLRRLVFALQAEGHQKFAAALPRNALGDALAQALTSSLASAGLPAPSIRRYGASFSDRSNAMKEITNYVKRRGPVDAPAQGTDTPSPAAPAATGGDMPPPPFDVLLLAEGGGNLASMTALLPAYGVEPGQAKLIGPAFWATEAGKNHDLDGAWYAGPDPSSRASFVQRYQAKFGAQPPVLADLAYDAAAIGRVLKHDNDISAGGITRPDGFAGVDGVLGLLPDGHARRGLAVFELQRGGSQIVEPAPQNLATPGV